MIERVEHVDAELQFHLLFYCKVLENREIKIVDAGQLQVFLPAFANAPGRP